MSSQAMLIAVPGLYWPTPGMAAQLRAQPLPGLQRLFAMARIERGASCNFDDWLCQLFEAGTQPDIARLRLAGEDVAAPEDGEGVWLCADPISLHFARDQFLVRELEAQQISLHEAETLVTALNTEFADIGRFFAATPNHWYLRTELALDVTLPGLAEASGRPAAYFQPTGEDRATWARISNELQVFCHNHPLNRQREAHGQPPINGLWLWGNGDTPALRTVSAQGSGNPSTLLRGLCRLSGTRWQDCGHFQPGIPLQVFSNLLKPVRQRDDAAWLAGLLELECEVFAPLAAALKSRKLLAARLVAAGDGATLSLQLKPQARWRFWQGPASMDSLAQLLCTPDPARPA